MGCKAQIMASSTSGYSQSATNSLPANSQSTKSTCLDVNCREPETRGRQDRQDSQFMERTFSFADRGEDSSTNTLTTPAKASYSPCGSMESEGSATSVVTTDARRVKNLMTELELI